MRRFRLAVIVVLAVCFCSAPNVPVPNSHVASSQAQTEKQEIRVWVNTHSGVYHCPGTRWYGNTKEGKYMSECEAQKDGYRPAYGKTCGSDCR